MAETTFTLAEVRAMGWIPPGPANELRSLVAEDAPWPPERAFVAQVLGVETSSDGLREIVGEWLADVADADADQPSGFDLYVRIGARWESGKYGERLREALSGD